MLNYWRCIYDKTGVINYPLGQTHSLASSEHCFHFDFEKWGRTYERCRHVRKQPFLPAVSWPSGSITILLPEEVLRLLYCQQNQCDCRSICCQMDTRHPRVCSTCILSRSARICNRSTAVLFPLPYPPKSVKDKCNQKSDGIQDRTCIEKWKFWDSVFLAYIIK